MKTALILLAISLVCMRPASAQQSDTTISIYFEFDADMLTQDDKSFIKSMLVNAERITAIKTYTDTSGSFMYNVGLSQRRANAVVEFLREIGWINDLLQPEFFGERLSDGSNPALERRAEVSFQKREVKEVVMPKDEENEEMEDTTQGIRLELVDVYFVPNLPVIEHDSYPVLEEALLKLQSYEGCHFRIVGHVNHQIPEYARNDAGLMQSIQKLSEDRAKAVYNFMLERGIPAQSMSYTGKGNTEMRFPNPRNDEEKRKNMRVEIFIRCND